jgi:hypothetical protein
MDSITIEYEICCDVRCDEKIQKTFSINRGDVLKVTVVSNGFTCEMDADQFFKIIHEAFQW